MVLRLPEMEECGDDVDQDAKRRGILEGLLTAVHGLKQKDPRTSLGTDHKVLHPGIFESVNLFVPMCLAGPGFLDLIGGFETDNSISNGKRQYSPVSMVYVTNSDAGQIDIIVEAAKRSGLVIVVINVPRSEKKDSNKAPCKLAQIDPPPARFEMETEIEKALDKENVDNYKIVSADTVSAVSMLLYMRTKDKLSLAELQCAMAVHEANFSELLRLLHEAYLKEVAMLTQKAQTLDARKRELGSATRRTSARDLHPRFVEGLKKRKPLQVAKEVLETVYKSSKHSTIPNLATFVAINPTSIKEKLEKANREAEEIKTLKNLRASRQSSLRSLKSAMTVVDRRTRDNFDGLFEGEDGGGGTGVSNVDAGRCHAVVDDLFKRIIRDCDGRRKKVRLCLRSRIFTSNGTISHRSLIF